jgi:type IV pilus assembly protein PilY1
MSTKHLAIFAAAALALVSSLGRAQTVSPFNEDFTETSTANSWYFFNGACLTAGTSTSTTSPGPVPACTTVLSSYYAKQTNADLDLVGGYLGFLGASTAPASRSAQVADPVITSASGVKTGYGALRFTNGSPYGHNESGAIISATTYPGGQGIEVTFKTVTYLGDSGGTGKDGADGISFFLIDGTQSVVSLGSFGGSLGYSCSNTNNNYDGMTGAYLGVGIDEFGNFLNGTSLASGYTGTNTASGDNTAYGYGYKPDRIGIRGAGSVSWTALNTAYGTNPNSTTKPYYPSSLYGVCPSGTYYSGNNKCGSCSGGTFSATTGTCSNGSTPTWGATEAETAVQHTCATGTLYNYKTFSSPTSAGATLLANATPGNTANTANILDYAPIAYKELTSFQIAAESATTRATATPIFYDLKITQDGLLSLSYSISGGAYSYLIKGADITAVNGLLPSQVRFGFAGSTGGDTNIHEIMCFKAAPAVQSGSSASVNEKQSAKVQAGNQAYFAYYNPNDWTGTITANNLIDTNGVVTVESAANWDAQCLLNGVASGTCANTGLPASTTGTPTPANRVMLTWDTTNFYGIPFEWASLNSTQQATLDYGDATATSNRLLYLRGTRTSEINSLGVGLYRARDGILGDMVDSSPVWVGPPSSPWPTVWVDRLNSGASLPENTAPTSYAQFTATEATRLNVVYAGANDGFLHGFRSGSFDSGGNFCGTPQSTISCAATPNDGQEVLAYMPGSTLVSAALPASPTGCLDNSHTGTLVQNIHGWTPPITPAPTPACADPESTLDYSSSQYGHNFFVDATPGTGDLFFNNNWHTWLVSGLGAGGAAIFALDITKPGTFAEANAKSTATNGIVMGEWNASTLVCANTTNANTASCGQNLGNTYGTPQIRRLHNGDWGVIFGNGFGSQTGDAGIYVMTLNSTSGASSFYYLSTNASGGSSPIFTGTGSQAANVVTIKTVTSGFISVGDVLSGAGVEPGSIVSSFGTGTGGTGTYYVSTSGTVSSGAVTAGNGIAYTAPADLDGDHITDYVYAGDLHGNVWRFDLTSANPAQWGVTNANGVSVNIPSEDNGAFAGGGSPSPLFNATTAAGVIQPITTQLLVVQSVTGNASRLLIEFGTGQRTQLTNVGALAYVSGTQSLYGVWDWNLAAWNGMSTGSYASLASGPTLGYSNLTAQTLSAPDNNGVVAGTNVVVCWQGSTSCTSGNTSYGWYANLPSANEQVIYNPVFFQGAIVVNSTVPANNVPTSCSSNLDSGYTYALSVANGGVFTNTFPTYTKNGTVVTESNEAGVNTNATGSVYVVNTTQNVANIVYQTIPGTPGAQQLNIPSNIKAKRLTWVERR